MDFDTQLEEILTKLENAVQADILARLAIKPSRSPKLSHREAKVAIKQLIESKQPEKPYSHPHEPTYYFDMGYNAAISAWREGMGLVKN